jgi:hypothetical protein
VAQEASVKGQGVTGKTRRRYSDGSATITCPSRVRLTDQHNSHAVIGQCRTYGEPSEQSMPTSRWRSHSERSSSCAPLADT